MSARDERTRTRAAGAGLAMAVFAAASFATSGFVANELVDDGRPPMVVAFYEALVGLALVLAIHARDRRGARAATRASMGWSLAAGLAFAIAFGSFYTALSRIDFSVAAPIVGAVPLVSYVAVLFLLRGEERITKRALLGGALVVAGVGIIGTTR